MEKFWSALSIPTSNAKPAVRANVNQPDMRTKRNKKTTRKKRNDPLIYVLSLNFNLNEV